MGSGKGSASGLRSFPGKLYGGPKDPYVTEILEVVAVARGLRNVDELMIGLGKQGSHISYSQATDMLEEELGFEAAHDIFLANYYSKPGNCKVALRIYTKHMISGNREMADRFHQNLIRFCGYTDDVKK